MIVVVVVVGVVVVYVDGDGIVEVDATFDATAARLGRASSACSASNASTSINEPCEIWEAW